MGLFFTAIWVVVIISVVKASAKNAKRKDWDAKQQQSMNQQIPGSTPVYRPNPTGTGYGNTPAMPRPNSSGNVQSYTRTSRSSVPTGNNGTMNVVDTDGDGKISTTEYLAQKARLDEQEHIRDEYMTKQKLTQGGSLRLALQIPDDGMIPPGMRMCNCGYCGAENVLPQGLSQREFHCYFCHEQL